MKDLEQNTTTEAPRLPFSPLTGEGLSIQINDHASHVTCAVASHRHMDPKIRAEAALVLDMCRARTNRIVADIRAAVPA